MLAAGPEPSPREWQEAVGVWACFEGSTRAPADSGVGGVYSSRWRPGFQLVQCTPSGPLVNCSLHRVGGHSVSFPRLHEGEGGA